jgi:hypothetical protein
MQRHSVNRAVAIEAIVAKALKQISLATATVGLKSKSGCHSVGGLVWTKNWLSLPTISLFIWQ